MNRSILFVPSVIKGNGSGHIVRCLSLAQRGRTLRRSRGRWRVGTPDAPGGGVHPPLPVVRHAEDQASPIVR